MKTRRLLYALPLLLLALPLAHASITQNATGTFTTSATTISSQTFPNGFTLVFQNLTFAVSGDVTGGLIAKDIILVTASGQGFFLGIGTFTGTILGRTGTIKLFFTGTFTATSTTPPFTGQVRFLTDTGTGGLTSLVGNGSIQGTIDVGGTYSFFITFPFHAE